MFKRIRDTIAATLYHLILFLVKISPAKKGTAHLLIIKTDEIGDYILFRNYFEDIRESNKYKNYKITLVGNIAWKSILETYDLRFFDKIIWINKKQFKKDLHYRFSTLKQVRKLEIEEVINCVYSRSLLMDDGFAIVTKAVRIAMDCDDIANRKFTLRVFDKLYYHKIISAGDKKIFDNTRNRNFVSTLINDPYLKSKLFLTTNTLNPLPKNYFVIFLGAGNPERKWPVSYYATIANYIFTNYGLVPLLCGSDSDVEDAKRFSMEYNQIFHDYTGKTNLPELIEILFNAAFLISVDTGAVHMAASVKCPVIGLFSGKFYGRFAPYPQETFNRFYPVYPDFVDKLIEANDPVLYQVEIMKNNTMKLILPPKIYPVIDKIMRENKGMTRQ